jgi:glucosamine--fructose-6-phosphate aminotransferase (isomerizing)
VHDHEVEREARVVEAHAAAVELARTATSCRRKSSSSRALGDTLEGISAITPELFGENAAQFWKSTAC